MTADHRKRIPILLAASLAWFSPLAARAADPSVFETFDAACLKTMPDLAAAESAARRLGLTIPDDAKVEGDGLSNSRVLMLGSPPDGIRQIVFLGSGDGETMGAPGVENRICSATATVRDEAGRKAMLAWLGDMPPASKDEQVAMYLFTEAPEGRAALKPANDPRLEAAAKSGRLVVLMVSDIDDQTSFTLVRTMPAKETR